MGSTSGLSIGGMAEQDLASIITPFVTSDALNEGVRHARQEVVKGYRSAQGSLDSSYDTAKTYQQPYYDTGTRNLATLDQQINSGAYNENATFQFDYKTDPGYQFRMSEGINQINNSAAARGGLLSGSTLKALARYGQNFASNEYQNAYGRARNAFESDRNFNANQKQMQYNRVAGLAGMGQAAGNNLSSLASNYGSNSATLAQNQGSDLANLQLMKGNIEAGKWQAVGDAFVGQGAHLQQIGAGDMSTQYYGNNSGSSGGGSSGSSQLGGFDLSSIFSNSSTGSGDIMSGVSAAGASS